MFNRFTKDARALVGRAEIEAKLAGSPTIEAEHLLLAYAASGRDAALADAGLSHEVLTDALVDEYEASLRAVGVSEETIRAATSRAPRSARLGASFKAALERAVKDATSRGERRVGARYVARGVLGAKRGAIPRALRAAGFDPGELRAKL